MKINLYCQYLIYTNLFVPLRSERYLRTIVATGQIMRIQSKVQTLKYSVFMNIQTGSTKTFHLTFQLSRLIKKCLDQTISVSRGKHILHIPKLQISTPSEGGYQHPKVGQVVRCVKGLKIIFVTVHYLLEFTSAVDANVNFTFQELKQVQFI